MKKKVAILLGAVMIIGSLSLTGCGQNQPTNQENNQAVTQQNNQNNDANETKANLDENKKAILVVSFGTSYNDSREKTIGAVEKKIAETYPDYDQKRAFTSNIIINKLKERDNIEIDTVDEALQKLLDEGYGTVVIQPTHVMNGEEYDEMKELTADFEDKFINVKYGTPLLTSSDDYEEAIKAIMDETPQVNEEGTAIVFMGHGTEHYANASYAALDYRFKALGYNNVFVGTVESYPDLDKVKSDVAKGGYKKVVLIPLMIVAGDHANNDMAGDEEDSWKTQFKKDGYEVEVVLKGLGEYAGIQQMFAEHCGQAIEGETETEE